MSVGRPPNSTTKCPELHCGEHFPPYSCLWERHSFAKTVMPRTWSNFQGSKEVFVYLTPTILCVTFRRRSRAIGFRVISFVLPSRSWDRRFSRGDCGRGELNAVVVVRLSAFRGRNQSRHFVSRRQFADKRRRYLRDRLWSVNAVFRHAASTI